MTREQMIEAGIKKLKGWGIKANAKSIFKSKDHGAVFSRVVEGFINDDINNMRVGFDLCEEIERGIG